MNIGEEFETGPAEGLGVVARDPRFLELTPSDMLTLVQFSQSPAYQVLLKLFEGECEKTETDHFRKWNDKELFERTGLFAVAMRIGYERVQREIARQVEEFRGEVDFARKKKELAGQSPEEQIQGEFR